LLKKQLDDALQELASVKQVNESLKASIQKQEKVLADHAFKATREEKKNNEEDKEEDVDDHVNKLGERLNEMMRRFTVMPK
jgi:F0F1-type ATP synthase membrane subunit b/b'